MNIKRVALYLRVSTDGQTTDNQRRTLMQIAAGPNSSWVIDPAHIYLEHVSGAKSRCDRPQFDALLQAATRREFDLVAAWSVDRLGRSLQDLIGFLQEIQSLGIDLYLHQQSVDTSTPSGRMMFQMLGVFAEFERSMIQSRVRAGLDRARANGKRLGRPATSPLTQREIIDYMKKNPGDSLQKVADQFNLSRSMIHKIRSKHG